ncbi:MAG TPA: hypothetical protein DCE41_33345 [Cytophagales bacterium]|nr:hypothetical protein [Cytophagales bacterium]
MRAQLQELALDRAEFALNKQFPYDTTSVNEKTTPEGTPEAVRMKTNDYLLVHHRVITMPLR